MKDKDVSNLEVALSNNAYQHGRTYEMDMKGALIPMHIHLEENGASKFQGLTVDTIPVALEPIGSQSYHKKNLERTEEYSVARYKYERRRKRDSKGPKGWKQSLEKSLYKSLERYW